MTQTGPDPKAAPTPPRKPSPGDGFRALFSGVGFVLGRPSLWPLALVPLAVALALLSLLGYGALTYVPARIGRWLGGEGHGTAMHILSGALKVMATALSLLLAALLAFGLAQPLSGPALERLVRRAEAEIGLPAWPKTRLVDDVRRSLQTVLLGYALALPILLMLLVIDFVFPPAVVVTFPLKLIVTALMIAWDLCDYPLSIRGGRVSARLSLLSRHIWAVIGFGAALSLLSLLPCALLLVLPAGVCGAAHLVAAIERYEHQKKGREGT